MPDDARADVDDLDGCELDFAADAVDEDETELLPLFPQGADTPDLEAKAADWAALFGEKGSSYREP